MRIVLYTHTYNEELIMPYFLRHYETFCDKIIVYDNDSTDDTVKIATSCPKVELRSFKGGDKIDDAYYMEWASTVYTEQVGKADFVIMVDADEFVHHPHIREMLDTVPYHEDYIRSQGYQMVHPHPPISNGQIYDEIKTGAPSDLYSKIAIFRPDVDMYFGPGRHSANPRRASSRAVRACLPKVNLLHYSCFGIEHMIGKYKRLSARLSQSNIEHGWGNHYLADENKIRHDYAQLTYAAQEVV